MNNKQAEENRAARGNSLFVSREHALYLGRGFATRSHAPHALTIWLALDGTFRLRTGPSANREPHRAAIIAPDRPRRVNARGASLAVFYFPPERADARAILRGGLADGGVAQLPRRIADSLTGLLSDYLERGCSAAEAGAVCDDLLRELSPAGVRSERLDGRVMRALEYLHGALERHPRAEEIARAAWASHGRLAHLFKEQTGVALRYYQRWMRLCAAVELTASCRSLTEAAHAAGFADSSHLTHTFREMLGVRPSDLLRRGRVVAG